jgi:4-diphosphocytidyl-2-C-methyl-D-erythritol kinase
MQSLLVEQAYAKINLTLRITGPFAAASGAVADNLVLKAAQALGAPSGRFRLIKNIPVAAGLGGGSADAAAALRLIARANRIALDDPRVTEAARKVGADVPVCLDPRPRVMRGIGEILSPLVPVPKLPAVLVNPGVQVATKDVFAKLDPGKCGKMPLDDIPSERTAFIAMLAKRTNDLTLAALAVAPVIADILGVLSKSVSMPPPPKQGPRCASFPPRSRSGGCAPSPSATRVRENIAFARRGAVARLAFCG